MQQPFVISMVCFVIFSVCAAARADEYPTKPIRAVVPLVPGGGTDIAARVVGQKLTERWGQQVIVDHRPGAGGNIGAEIVARAVPDGHTMLITNPGPVVVNLSLMAKMPYDPVKDLVPVVMLAPTYYLLITHPSVPGNSMRDLIQVAKKRPNTLVLASGGLGGPVRFDGRDVQKSAQIDAVIVQYKGGGQALADVIGGQASMMFVDMIAGTA